MTSHRFLRAALPVLVLPFVFASVSTQGGQQAPAAAAAQPTPAPAPQQPAPPAMINASSDPMLAPFRFRSIGPASMGGRIDDIAVSESEPNIIYLGYAVGGVFKSENNGTTFDPVFQTYNTA